MEEKTKNTLSDDKNPDFIFSTTHTSLLCEAVKGDIHLVSLAKKQLARRGLNKDGVFVGFDEARRLLGWQESLGEDIVEEVNEAIAEFLDDDISYNGFVLALTKLGLNSEEIEEIHSDVAGSDG